MVLELQEPQHPLQARMALAALPCIPGRIPAALGESSVAGARMAQGPAPSVVRTAGQPTPMDVEQDMQVNKHTMFG